MASTLKTRIFDAITAEFPNTLTNQQLAARLGANEPSVRRATLELSHNYRIRVYDGGYAGLPVQYRGIESPGQSAPV